METLGNTFYPKVADKILTKFVTIKVTKLYQNINRQNIMFL